MFCFCSVFYSFGVDVSMFCLYFLVFVYVFLIVSLFFFVSFFLLLFYTVLIGFLLLVFVYVLIFFWFLDFTWSGFQNFLLKVLFFVLFSLFQGMNLFCKFYFCFLPAGVCRYFLFYHFFSCLVVVVFIIWVLSGFLVL